MTASIAAVSLLLRLLASEIGQLEGSDPIFTKIENRAAFDLGAYFGGRESDGARRMRFSPRVSVATMCFWLLDPARVDVMNPIDTSVFVSKFVEEARDRLKALGAALLRLEETPGSADAIADALRESHSIKGSALMLGFTDISQISHKLEDLFVAAKTNATLSRRRRVRRHLHRRRPDEHADRAARARQHDRNRGRRHLRTARGRAARGV